jgi:tetratricopeptide (TPR) repeat protein
MYGLPPNTIARSRPLMLAGICWTWALGCGHSATRLATIGSETSQRNDNAERLFQEGTEAAHSGDTLRAEQYLSMALEAGFDQHKLLPLLLRVCLQSSRLRSALDHAEPYLLQHPEDRTLRYLVATIHLSLGQIEEARLNLEELLRTDRRNADAHYLLGILEMRLAPSKAADHLHMYLSLAPAGSRSAEAKSRLLELEVRAAGATHEIDSIRRSAKNVDESRFGELVQSDDKLENATTAAPSNTDSSWETTQP